jgi:energy-coupling factor transporter ATP-binding protein EcfA2
MNKLELSNFKAFLTSNESISIEFDNKSFLLYGDNGSGKSSIYEAIKLCFYYNKFIPNIEQKTQEEKQITIEELLQQYTNTQATNQCEIKINDIGFNEFDNSNYSVFMLTFDDLFFENEIRLDKIVQNLYYIDDVEQFCKDNFNELVQNINSLLKNIFKEDIQIDIDEEDNYKIRIKNESKNIEYKKSDIKRYFNEARLNLVVLLIAFESIKISQKKDNSILVLDDFITSLDVANRTFIIKYIFDNFKDCQIIILTHNVFFYNLIMYMINEYYKTDEKLKSNRWQFANLYEIGNKHTIYIKGLAQSAKDLQNEFNNSVQDIDVFGNKVRQRFEILLYELSKLLIVGAVEESKDIIHKIDMGNSIYLNEKVLDKIEKILNNLNIPDDKLRERLLKKINVCKKYSFKEFQEVVKELKLYQKITLHPMSHGKIGQSSYTTNELKQSLELLVKLEANIEKLVKRYHVNVDGA